MPGATTLELVRPTALPTYGTSARFCFDDATGAVRELIQRRDGSTDTFEATVVRGDVSPADFSLTPDTAYDAQVPTAPDGGPNAGPGATSGTSGTLRASAPPGASGTLGRDPVDVGPVVTSGRARRRDGEGGGHEGAQRREWHWMRCKWRECDPRPSSPLPVGANYRLQGLR